MRSASIFKRLPEADGNPVTISFNGRPVPAREGDTVAAALIAAGHPASRSTAVSGAVRGPFCMMGACFECLVEIDGVANRQACMVQVRDGMRVNWMEGPPRLAGADHD